MDVDDNANMNMQTSVYILQNDGCFTTCTKYANSDVA